jgi:ectoine hydroxylase
VTRPPPAARQDLYPSRTGDEARVLERRDAVVHGERPDQISPEHWQHYARNGFLFIPDFLPPHEVGLVTDELRRLPPALSASAPEEVILEPGGDAVRSVFRVHEHSAVVAELVRSPQLIAMVEAILGGPVYVHQSRINYKPGFTGKEFYWHSDFETWHVEDGMPRMRALSCSINLTDNTPFNGPLMVIPGSHRRYVACEGRTPERNYERSLVAQDVGVPSDEALRSLVAEHGIEAPTGGPGSLLLFDCNLMHGSAGNITPQPRSNVFMVFNSVHNGLQAPFSGQPPRPEYLASRTRTTPLQPRVIDPPAPAR